MNSNNWLQAKHSSINRARGFTLIEIMVVVVILGILATLVVPKIMGRPDQARQEKARADISAIRTALDLYKTDNYRYPTTAQGLQALVTKPEQEPIPTNYKGYLAKLPIDPWDTPYQYLNPGLVNEVDVFSFGADRQPGGEGVNADITSDSL